MKLRKSVASYFGMWLRLPLESKPCNYLVFLTFKQIPLPVLHVKSGTVDLKGTRMNNEF